MNIRGKILSYAEIYRENYDDVVIHTIRLQKHFSACVSIIYFAYTVSMFITDYLLWGIWRPVLLLGLCIGAVAAINWGLLQKGAFLKGKTAILAGNVFLLVLLESLVVVRNVSDGYISNTLIICTILSTAIISFQPKQYTIMILIATISEMGIAYADYVVLTLPFATIVNFWIDAWILLITAISINLIIAALRYSLLEEKHQLRKESIVDAMTGLYTRRYFERFFQLHYREDERSAMIHMDLDNFKMLNDTMGHHQGDRLLEQVADILREHFRKTDCVARVGGDEFMVFMTSLEDSRQVFEKMDHILTCFPILVEEDGREVKISISIGVVFSESGKALKYQEFYEKADAAMYQAKHGGKGRVVFVDGDGNRI